MLIDRHRLAAIFLAAALTTLFLVLLTRLPGTHGGRLNGVTVEEQNGVYDLTGVLGRGETSAFLPPAAAYYPGVLLTPDTADAATPTGAEQFAALRSDCLSQRFMLKLPDTENVYALTFQLSGRHAMRVYVNGALAGETGRVGTTKRDTEVWENNITVFAAAAGGRMDIILNSAQFYHARGGANLAALIVQEGADAAAPRLSEPIKGFFIMGALLCAAGLLLCIFLFLSHTRATLFFALACVTMALRECIQSQAWTYFPVSGNLVFMLEYMSVVLLTVFLSLYLIPYATNRFLRAALGLAVAASAAYGLLLLLGDSIVYTRLLVVYQVLLVVAIVPGIGGLFWTVRRPSREQAAALYGIAVFYIAAVADILLSSHLLGDGHHPTISEMAMLVFMAAQTVSLFFVSSREMAESRQAEQRLAAEKAALEGLDRMKTEFLGNVSHELKTPLTVISGYAQNAEHQLLSPEPDSTELAGKMKVISSEAKRLGLLVGQILDVTRIEEGRMKVELVRCTADEFIETTIAAYYPLLSKNNNRLVLRIDGGLPDVLADPVRVSQILVNLLSNAIRFTTDGTITVSARVEDGFVAVSVADTGAGIAPELLPHVFDRYVTKQKSGGGQDTGTGLGLYICKYLVDAHGGTISAESTERKGSIFRFTLPIAALNSGPC